MITFHPVLQLKNLVIFDPKTDILRIHVTMVINNPGNIITEKIHGTIVTKNRASRLLKDIIVAIEEPPKCTIKHMHVAK